MGNFSYDAIVIGAGHAGIEAALALARTDKTVLVLSVTLDNVGYCSCNPSIGGSAKGHLVKEIDALGGEMGVATDRCLLSIKMLNASKGPAVRSLRAQVDKYKYHYYMKQVLENNKNISLRQGEASEILTDGGKVCGVKTVLGLTYHAKAVVIASGVYLNSNIIVGEATLEQGPSGFPRASKLTSSLIALGVGMRRFKTGTPARVHRDSLDLSKFALQHDEKCPYSFSSLTKKVPAGKENCYLGYTNETTHKFIQDNLHLAPRYNGQINSLGPRYCPSIEDKIVKFADKPRHQFFIEPEGDCTKEMYVQGLSTSFPAEVQLEMYRSIEGFENVEIMRDAYAIEYDCIDSMELYPTLEHKSVGNLYFAGQVNGTSGYEEAAAQGLVAGLNASLKLSNSQPLLLSRESSYIGVMIDDLVTVGTDEPYRMMTGRAEHRLLLRQDNADIRLTPLGYEKGLASKVRLNKVKRKISNLGKAEELSATMLSQSRLAEIFEQTGCEMPKSGLTIKRLVLRAEITAEHIRQFVNELDYLSDNELDCFITDIKYEGYITIQNKMHSESVRMSGTLLPADADYSRLTGLRREAQEKLAKIKPLTLGQASRINGVNPADINVLIINLKKLI